MFIKFLFRMVTFCAVCTGFFASAMEQQAELLDAVQSNDAMCIQQLAHAGVDIHGDHERAFFEAVTQHKWDAMRVLIELGAHVHVGGNIALRTVVNHRKNALIRQLVERGADIDVGDGMALRSAVRAGGTYMVEFLLNHGANVNVTKMQGYGNSDTPLSIAIERDNFSMIELLVAFGATITDEIMCSVLAKERYAIADFFLHQRAAGNNPVDINRFASQFCWHTNIRWCIEHGANERSLLDKGLCSAVECGNVSAAQWFVEHGADVNADDGQILVKAVDACYRYISDDGLNEGAVKKVFNPEKLCMIAWLFDQGMHQAHKERALIYASNNLCSEVVDELIRLGVSPNAVSGKLVQMAIERRNLDDLVRLVAAGADIGGDRFMRLAENAHDDRIVRFLHCVRRR